MLAALQRDVDIVQKVLLAGGDFEALRLDHGSAASRRVEEIEAEPFLAHRQRFQLAARLLSLALEAPDLGQLRLRLFGLVLLVAEAFDEALQPRDVDAEAIGRPPCSRGAGGFLDPPGMPRTGKGDRAAAGQLEYAVRDRLEEPAIVRDQDDSRVERLQFLLEPLEAGDVEMVRRLVEQQQIRVAAEGPGERGTRELAAGKRLEGPVEIRLGEAEPTDD